METSVVLPSANWEKGVSRNALSALKREEIVLKGEDGMKPEFRILPIRYFFSPACQLRTTVNGAASCVSGTRNKKRLPSGEVAQREPEAPGGA